jgi:subtilisin-like proprotein convertase family protein
MKSNFTQRLMRKQIASKLTSMFSTKYLVVILALILQQLSAFAQTTQTFNSSSSWTPPAGVTSVTIECWGAGGSGGGNSNTNDGGGGGGGGAYSKGTVTVVPGTPYTVTVGTGGNGNSGSNGSPGGDSWFSTNTSVMAKGGGAGLEPTGPGGVAGTGGQASAGFGNIIKFSGGNGGAGRDNSTGTGGGGGSSAGTAANGAAGAVGAGSAGAGGTAPAGGGNGGNGGASTSNGSDGVTPGGGGGGSGDKSTFGSNRSGGDGANGRITVTYTCPTYGLSSTTVAAVLCPGNTATINLTGSAAEMPVGSFTITYSLSGANTGSGITAALTVSTAGTGSFNTGILANGGNTNITITNISSGSGSTICSSSISSNNTAVIDVISVDPGSISGVQSLCVGSDPSPIQNATLGSGPGTISYTWEQSTTSATAGFTLIGGANLDSYDPPAGISTTTWYRRITESVSTSTCTATTAAIQVSANTANLPSVLAVASSNPVCIGSNFNLSATSSSPFTSTANPNIAITDNSTTGITSLINVSGLPTSLSGWKVEVAVSATTTYNGDLEFYLVRPGGTITNTASGTNRLTTTAGQSIALSTDNGGSGDNYNNVLFRDDAATNITSQSGNVTIAGSYIPEQLLSTLSGNPNGDWTLRVVDDAADDFGTLTTWTLTITYINGLSYSWTSTPSGFTSSVQNPGSTSITQATTFSVLLTDNVSGCTATSDVLVNTIASPEPKIIPGDTILCNGTNLYLHVVDTGAYIAGYPVGTSIEWVNIITNTYPNDSIDVIGNGSSFQVIVTLPSGCSGTSAVRTVLSKAIVPNETIYHANCNLTNGKIVANMVLGSAPFRYIWKDNGVIIRDTVSNELLDSIYNLAAGTYTLELIDNYLLANPNEPSCTGGPYSYTINNIPPPAVSITTTNISCYGLTDGILVANPTLGTPPFSYNWSNGANTASIISLIAGTYSVTVTDANGCTTSGQSTIVEPDSLSIDLAYTEPLCSGNSDGIIASVVQGGTGTILYEWFDSGFLPIGTNNDSLIGITAGTYYLLVSDINSCSANQSIVVEDPPLLTSTCSAIDATCFGYNDGSASVIASGGRGTYSYLWSNNTNSTSNTSLTSGTYTVTVTDGNGCTSVCVTTVNEPQIVSATITGSDVNCANDVTTISVVGTGGTAPYTGEGSFVVGVGTHTYPIVDNIGCSGSASITINHLDNVPPTILDCPSNITQCDATVNWTAPTASDNCTLVSFTSNFNSGSTFSVGTTQVVYTATDNAGLISTCTFDVTILPTPIWYEDLDADGFGNPLVSITNCIQPVGYISDGAGAPVACGVSSSNDCNDNNAAINPGAAEVCNGIDDDCNGLSDDGLTFLNYYVDVDGDGYGAGLATSSCNPIVGSVLVDGDCDDNNAAVNPGATEVCNGIDDDCNGLSDDGLTFLNYYVDADGDGFGAGLATSSCNPIVGSVLVDGDCDDNAP